MAFEHVDEPLPSLATNEMELVCQIRQYFNDLKISEYDLKKPTSAFVIEFYKVFLSEFFINPNVVTQIQMCQATMLAEYSDMYNEIIPLINLTKAIKSFKIPDLKSFCIYDLINPTPRRTFIHISHVMQFINFADSRVAVLLQKLGKKKVLEEKKQMILKNIDTMKQLYNARVMDIENRKTAVKDKDAEIDRLSSEMQKMEREKEILALEYSKVKSKHEEIFSKHEDASKQLDMLKNDIKELSDHVKQLKGDSNMQDANSEMLSSEILEEKVKQTSETLDHMRESLTLKQTHMEDLSKYQKKLTSIVQVVKELSKNIETTIVLDEKRNEIEKQFNETSENIEKMKSSNVLVEQELLKRNEELTGLRLQWSKQKSSLMESLNFAKSKFEDKERNNVASIEILEEINKYEQKIIENENAYDVLCDGIEDEKNRLDKEKVNMLNKLIELTEQ